MSSLPTWVIREKTEQRRREKSMQDALALSSEALARANHLYRDAEYAGALKEFQVALQHLPTDSSIQTRRENLDGTPPPSSESSEKLLASRCGLRATGTGEDRSVIGDWRGVRP